MDNPIVGYGKVILLGEHAVVYGTPALGASLPFGVRLTGFTASPYGLRAIVPEWVEEYEESGDSVYSRALRRVSELVGGEGGGVLEFASELPKGGGLGASAAFSAALARGTARIRGKELTLEETRKIAHELEKFFHGSPSGFDDTAACYGGILLFSKRGFDAVETVGLTYERLTEEAIKLKIKPFRLIVADSGAAKDTGKMVARVKEFCEARPSEAHRIFGQIEKLVYLAAKAAANGDLEKLGRAMNENMSLLRDMGLSHPKLEAIIDGALSGGAFGAKLTGGGGGGCVIAVAPEEAFGRVRENLSKLCVKIWEPIIC